jgi:DNA-binding HxlR family transcriptional regulator
VDRRDGLGDRACREASGRSDRCAHLVLLGKRAYRFNELHRGIETISQRMLTRTLRGLETDGLVHRKVFPTVPPSVEYSITPLGRTLLVPLSALADWVVDHRVEIAEARVTGAD